MFRRLIPDPFIAVLVGTMIMATLLPARGGFALFVDYLADAAIMLLFFLHGAKLPRAAVIEALGHWRLHLTILGCTFLLFPMMTLGAAAALPALLPPPLWTGMLFLAALPSTVNSSIAFTAVARGNVAGAIVSASASNLIGIVLTPSLVALLAEAHGATVELSGIGRILLQLLLPFVAGHLLRPWIGDWVARRRKLFGYTDRSTIVIAVYGAFSGAVVDGIWHRLPIDTLLRLVLACLVLLAIMLVIIWRVGKSLRFGRADRIAILFCGTKKSLISGVPIARVLFAGPQLGLVLLPIMIFHQLQLMACAWIAQAFARQAEADDVR